VLLLRGKIRRGGDALVMTVRSRRMAAVVAGAQRRSPREMRKAAAAGSKGSWRIWKGGGPKESRISYLWYYPWYGRD